MVKMVVKRCRRRNRNAQPQKEATRVRRVFHMKRRHNGLVIKSLAPSNVHGIKGALENCYRDELDACQGQYVCHACTNKTGKKVPMDIFWKEKVLAAF